MAVASDDQALVALRQLLGDERVPASAVLHQPYLPRDVDPSPDPVRLEPTSLMGGYGNPAHYLLGGDDAELALLIAGPPADTLSGSPDISPERVNAYLTSSLDLTMQGGTTSGVVYPLAVCELASQFRFRNVGGASAGAIAAALTAAAELGRSESTRHPERPVPETDAAGDPAAGVPRIQRGFVGLTDIIGWLTQTRPGDGERDEFRLAQMFRPGANTRKLFRVVVAAMRQRTWALPLLAVLAFRRGTWVVAGLLIAATVLLTGWIGGRFSGVQRSAGATLGWGLVDSATFVATIVAVALLLQGVPRAIRQRAERRHTPPRWLRLLQTVTSASDRPKVLVRQQPLTGAVLLGVVVAVAVTRTSAYGAAVLVGLAGSFVVIATLAVSTLAYVGHLRSSSFGLLPGSTPRQPTRNVLDVLAGVPASTVELSVVPWLNDCLGRLAGLPAGEVLRFGHLWSGADFHEVRTRPTPELLARWQQMSERTDHRLVNLELMTTDLTRQRPYRFPLRVTGRDDPDQLWVCVDQFVQSDGQLFPDAVLDILRTGEKRVVRDRSGAEHTLHRLLDPWDLPVIVAVRLSMALPVLFQAVRMYRVVVGAPVQDDFGRELRVDGRPLVWPDVDDLADEVWFSDGGITSNFPVHFFDSPLPRWPTVSLNLGAHPEAAPHQDVSLPQDWDVTTIPVRPLTDSGLSLGSGVFDTAMSWRDNMQSAMPGYRNRIAQVRTRPDEGGTNLFMSRQTVASLALRGALAGARLRTRFGNADQWDRFRWLRLRTALSNLERLRRTTEDRQRFYADALGGPGWLARQRADFCDQPTGRTIDWYQPDPPFWPAAPELLSRFAQAYSPPAEPGVDVLTTRVPLPEPVLRQVPQE